MTERVEVIFRRIDENDEVQLEHRVVAELDSFNQSRTRDWFRNLFNDVSSKICGDYGFRNAEVQRKTKI